ncbi:amidohydrolase family protein [Halomonas organivorans]|uniref:Cytosine/adenosine deaminase-related metal-dependent hydrolase n=1 Tax=Halomonas organivorans TaxID=257772 RepID=A0A7W5BZB1_9GAMM|nr:amidohydrolase family protein [Halomonas organivorans]MBB3141927.1 cytosine/adenosine deaminase-related metal-dependent hydrolase [Halomonas organivorans]
MHDQIFVNGVAADGNDISLAVKDGRIARIGALPPQETAAQVIDLNGHLVLPGLVDGHIHLDKSFVGDRWRPHRHAATLRERLAVEKRELAEARPIEARANALLRQASRFGSVAMRCHVDVDATTGLEHLHALLEVRQQWRDLVDIELVAFPQAGVVSCPGTAELLDAAVREGADVVGGIDPTTLDAAAEAQLDIVFGIAEKRGVKIDLHLHEPGHLGIAQLARIAERTRALGLEGRVAVSHAYCLGEVPPDAVARVAERLASADIAIMTNAPGDQAFPPVRALHDAGVRVFAGNDNIRDAWWPYGNGDMLQRAMLIGYRSGFYTDEALALAFEMASTAGARVMGRRDHGLAPGHEATFLVLPAPNVAAAVAEAPSQRALVKRGRFLSDTARSGLGIANASPSRREP